MRDDTGRSFYRVTYPAQERPALIIGDHELPVHDLSESGLRFGGADALGLSSGDQVQGDLKFRGRGERQVVGTIVWLRYGMAALEFDEPMPFETILQEQEYLRSRFSSGG